MSNAWDKHNQVKEPTLYGDSQTYKLGAEFLKNCLKVEDWGCGKGGLKLFIARERYYGIDGSTTPHADLMIDLREYQSTTPGLFMRHVLEHNRDWEAILQNALRSFAERMVLVVFTPFNDTEETKVLATSERGKFVDYALPRAKLELMLSEFSFRSETVKSKTQYGSETIYYIEKQRVTA